MAKWNLSPKYEKNIEDINFWAKEDKMIWYSTWWRGGTVIITTATDEAPVIDLDNISDDGLSVYDLLGDGETILDVEVAHLWDGDNSEWAVISGDASDELQEVIAAWEEDWTEGVENLGWTQEDTVIFFHGELILEKIDEDDAGVVSEQ